MRRRDVSSVKESSPPPASPLEVVRELDAFPKIPEGYKETTATGGGISIIVFVAIAILIISEIQYYTSSEMVYAYAVDTEFDGKLKINIDLTVAMKCSYIGADVLDLTGQSATAFGKLEEEDVYFELSPKQRVHFNMITSMNDYIRNEYHAIHQFLWRSGLSSMAGSMPAREVTPEGPTDACRLHGSLEVNKVAGNFHITAGKHIYHPEFHFHDTSDVTDEDYNFTHRIEHFSFGKPTPGIISPLDGEEKVTDKNYHMYQYFIQVVPTKVSTMWSTVDTYQFAVTEKNRTINHSKGSHGVPGIFVKYDLNALRVSVSEEHKPYWQFLVRLAAIVGGMFATSGILHQLVTLAMDLVCCRYKWGKYKPMLPIKQQVEQPTSLTSAPASPAVPTTSLQSGFDSTQSVNLLAQPVS